VGRAAFGQPQRTEATAANELIKEGATAGMKQVKGGGRGDASALARRRPFFPCGDHTTNNKKPGLRRFLSNRQFRLSAFFAQRSPCARRAVLVTRVPSSTPVGFSRFKRGQVSQVSQFFYNHCTILLRLHALPSVGFSQTTTKDRVLGA
jgi:hypothetical protein